MIEIAPGIAVAEDELVFVTSRAGGPGGQNVNKVETRVTLRFDVDGSSSLDEDQKRRVSERLRTRIGTDGVMRVTSQRHRTQGANRAAAVQRFAELLRDALADVPPRRPTRPTRRSRERRLADKRRRSDIKRERTASAEEG